jgi:RNA recognition motif-containing protein
VSDKFSGQSRGFGFVEMESPGDAAKAISEFDGKDLKDATSRSTRPSPENLAAAVVAPTVGRSGVGSARARHFRPQSQQSGQ